jgi:hypothetical protein
LRSCQLCSHSRTSQHFFFFLVCEAIGTAATPGLLCQPRVVIVKMIVEKQMECRLVGETNRSSRRKPAPAPLLSIKKSHMTRPGFEPGPPRWSQHFIELEDYYPLVPIVSHIDPVHTIPSHLSENSFNIIHPPTLSLPTYVGLEAVTTVAYNVV